MKTPDMSETNNLGNKNRTPNIFQNADRPLPSPTSSSMKFNETGPMSPALSPNSKSIISQKVQTLKQRKFDLDKLLMEKNSLLQQLCREEAKLIGCSTYSLNDITNIGGIDCSDGGADRISLNNNSTLRRHVDTGFKLPENLLNSNEDDINQLLLSKKIQQQISQASIRLANDVTQTKSIRRAHTHNYEIAQQKIKSINHSLSILKTTTNADRDKINVNNNMGYGTMNSPIIGNKNQLKPSLNISSTSLDNSNGMTERRNSAVSTGSASMYLMAHSSKSRPRCDSYNGQNANVHVHPTNANTINNNNNNTSNERIPHSPTYYQQKQIPHLHYKSHADKVAYVTNAVANAAAANNNINNNHSINGNKSMVSSPKYGRLRPLTVDTNVSESYYYPPSGSANHQHRSHFQQYYTQQHSHQHRHSPYSTSRNQVTPPSKIRSATLPLQTKNDTENTDDEDDIAGQYATLLTISDQTKSQHEIDSQETDPHYTEILCRKPSTASPVIDRSSYQSGSKDVEAPPKSQGLGGYWTTNENNERVWCSLDNRFSSLDRKSQKNKHKKQISRNVNQNQPTKSTSLGNFNFINKPDDLSEMSAAAILLANEQKRLKDKPWIETSLDAPPIRKTESISPSLLSPPIYYRDKNRLSSHSMHSPSRNPITNAANTMTALQSSQILSNLSKTLSTSATTLPAMENINVMQQQQQQQQQQQPLSPTYYHTTTTQTPIHFEHPPVNTIQRIHSPDVPSINHSYLDNSTNLSTSEIHVESPKNVTIVQPAKFQPYKEVSKPFEMSDFYKYSTKFRQKTASASLTHPENNSPQLPPKNASHQMKNSHRHIHPISINANVLEPPKSPYSINQ